MNDVHLHIAIPVVEHGEWFRVVRKTGPSIVVDYVRMHAHYKQFL